MCKLKEGRELHGKVKRKRKGERERESRSAANRACIFVVRADSLSRTRSYVYASDDMHVCIHRRKRTEASSLQDERHGTKERERERKGQKEDGDRKRKRKRDGNREVEREKEGEREAERENLFEDSWV